MRCHLPRCSALKSDLFVYYRVTRTDQASPHVTTLRVKLLEPLVVLNVCGIQWEFARAKQQNNLSSFLQPLNDSFVFRLPLKIAAKRPRLSLELLVPRGEMPSWNRNEGQGRRTRTGARSGHQFTRNRRSSPKISGPLAPWGRKQNTSFLTI